MATAAQQVLILYIMIAVGFFADKTGLYKEKAARMTNDLLFYIVTPAIITQSFLSMELTAENATALLVSTVCGFAMHGAAILISLPFFAGGTVRKTPFTATRAFMGTSAIWRCPWRRRCSARPVCFIALPA